MGLAIFMVAGEIICERTFPRWSLPRAVLLIALSLSCLYFAL
jgi:hypothetical protein